MSPKPAPRAYAVALNNQINVTPFVDVMLVLLIIFMVAAPLATVSLKLDVPPPSLRPVAPAPPAVVFIAPRGALSLSVGDVTHPTSLTSLDADLRQALGSTPREEARIVLRADRAVRYRGFMDVMNRLHVDGYQHISLFSERLD